MAKFHFAMDALLRIRKSTRDERRLELAAAERADAELQNQLAALADEQRQVRQQCRKTAGPGTVDLPRLAEAQRYAAVLHDRETKIQRRRQTLATEIQRRHQTLIEADREVRTLEKLRESQWQTHRQEQERQDAKRLDEMALQTK